MTGDRCEYPRAAVALFVFRINQEDRCRAKVLLLQKRPPRPSAGQWGLPGGRQELFETSEAAAAREGFEEVRLCRKPGNLVYQLTAEDIVPEINKHYVTRVYATWLADDGSEDAAITNGEPEKHEIGWFSIYDLPYPLTDAFKEILRAINANPAGLWCTLRYLGLEYAGRSADALAPAVP